MAEKTVPPEIVAEEAQRLVSVWKAHAKMSQAAFGDVNEIGSQGAVWQYLNGRMPLNLRVALKFARGLGVSVADFSPRLAKELGSAGVLKMEEPAPPSFQAHKGRYDSVPVVGTVQAGDEGYWLELDYPAGHGEGRIRYPSDDSNAYAVRVKGDSMRPRIKPGEFVVAEPNHPCAPGDEVIVRTKNGRRMVKVLASQRGGIIELLSINDDHKPISIDVSDLESMHYVASIVKSARYIPGEDE